MARGRELHEGRHLRPLIAAVATAVIAGLIAAAPSAQAAPAASFALAAPASVRTDAQVRVSAQPGARYAGDLAVLEAVLPRGSAHLAQAYVGPSGRVAFTTRLAATGPHTLRVRVIDGRRTVATSDRQTVTASLAGRRPSGTESASGTRMLTHAQRAAKPSRLQGRTLLPRPSSPTVNEWDYEKLLPDIGDAADGTQALLQVKNVVSQSFASEVANGLIDWGVGMGLSALMSVVFPGSGSATSGQVQQLANEMQNDFNQVLQQLNAIESALGSLQAQVTTEYDQLNAVATTGTCTSLLDQANDYVSTIQLANDNYQLTLSPSWLVANIGPYANSTSGIRVIGNQVFGSGSGTPSFASGLFATQQAVTNLAQLLNDNGASGTTGLVEACSSAIAAQIAASPGTFTTAGTQTIPAGRLDDSYFASLQAIVSYYSSWATIGQTLTAQGGQMAVAMLSPTPIDSANDVTSICAGATANGLPSLITCSGILSQIDQTQQQLTNAWGLTGASWGEVTNGLLGADTQINAAAGTLQSPQNVWTLDLATYASSGTPVPLPASTGAAVGPASGTTSLPTTSWLGLTFAAASSAAWDRLLAIQTLQPYPGASGNATTACLPSSSYSVTSCAAPQNVGGYMAAAGLQVNGAAPSNLIVYTGETTTWNPLQSAVLSDNRFFQLNGNSISSPFTGLDPNIPTTAFTMQSFLDSNIVPLQGGSAVVGNPGNPPGTLTPTSIYPFYSPVGLQNNSGTTSWTPTLSTAWPTSQVPSNPTQWMTYCPSGTSNLNPYPNAVPLNYGSLLGLPNGSSKTITGSMNFIQSGSCDFTNANSGAAVATTANSSFYANLTGAATWSYGAFSQLSSATLNWTGSGTSRPGFVTGYGSTNFTPQTQYLWPVANASSPGCTLTQFGQGFDGSSNATNTCENLWQEWSAVYAGQSYGSVQVTAPTQQSTQLPSGSQVMSVGFVNSSSAGQQVTVTLGTQSGGATVSSLVTSGQAGTSGAAAAVSNCSTASGTAAPTGATGTIVTCSVTVPPGTSTITVPLSYASGSSTANVVALVTGAQSTSAAVVTVNNAPAQQATPPAPVQNLTVTAESANPQTVNLSWETPASTPPLTGYAITITAPNGTATTSTIAASQVTPSVNGSMSTAPVTLPSTQAGYWEFSVAGVNQGGTGVPGQVTTYLGSGPPPAPANLTGQENPNGTVTLSWTPITASPPVSGYAVVAIDPTGVPQPPVTVLVPAFTTSALKQLGTWTFQVTAKNTAGSGPPASVPVTLIGAAPSAPTGLAVSISDDGWVSTSWSASASAVPAPTSYVLGFFDPSGKSVHGMEIPASGILTSLSVPKFFQIGSNSPQGTWTVTVFARNATGLGQAARGVMQVTPGVISSIKATQSRGAELAMLPPLLSDLDARECRAGLLDTSLFGTCRNRVWTPN